MCNLDINTAKGRISVKDEDVMLSFIKKSWDVDIIETKKIGNNASAAIDGLLVKNN